LEKQQASQIDEAKPVAVSTIIVSRCGGTLLAACLRATEAARLRLLVPSDITVVNNGGGASVAEVVTANAAHARVLDLRANVGYADAVMAAINATAGHWVATVNDDIVLEPDALLRLLEVGERDPRIGAVGAQIRFSDRREVLNSAGIEVDQLGVAFDRHLGAPVNASESEATPVFGVSGAAAMYRRRMLDELGGFDTSFFGYLEDVDLAWRAQMKGWVAVYVPSAVAYHHHSRTFTHGSDEKYFLVGRNRVRLLAKNATPRQLVRYAVPAAMYDVAYVLFVLATHRSLAPLRGRLAGIREWHRYRLRGAAGRRAVALAPPRGLRAALHRNRSWPRAARVLGER
jgi:GT2 family glycosyltransferase